MEPLLRLCIHPFDLGHFEELSHRGLGQLAAVIYALQIALGHQLVVLSPLASDICAEFMLARALAFRARAEDVASRTTQTTPCKKMDPSFICSQLLRKAADDDLVLVSEPSKSNQDKSSLISGLNEHSSRLPGSVVLALTTYGNTDRIFGEYIGLMLTLTIVDGIPFCKLCCSEEKIVLLHYNLAGYLSNHSVETAVHIKPSAASQIAASLDLVSSAIFPCSCWEASDELFYLFLETPQRSTLKASKNGDFAHIDTAPPGSCAEPGRVEYTLAILRLSGFSPEALLHLLPRLIEKVAQI